MVSFCIFRGLMRLTLLMILPLSFASSAYAQDGGQKGKRRGVPIDPEGYSMAPLSSRLMRGSTQDTLPVRFSLKHYVPTPGDQEDHPTNAAWAVAYNAYTCMKAIEQRCSDPAIINAMAFSPGYLYTAGLGESTPQCDRGMSVTEALDAMASKGTVSVRDFPDECDRPLPAGLKGPASRNRISAYRRLFGDQAERKERPLKESLSQKRPVVAALWYVRSFDAAGEIWTPSREEAYRAFGIQDSGVAITVVGYDDARFGGAFEVMNSQGTSWGEAGFCWIRYGTFNKFCVQAFEMIVDASMGPSDDVQLPDLALPPSSSEATIAGSFGFIDLYQRQISMSHNGEIYQVDGSDIPGSKFRIQIGAGTMCFVYVVAFDDQSHQTTAIFPDARFKQDERLKPNAQLVIPPVGSGYIQFDPAPGVDHFCFLFSTKRLDAAALSRSIDSGKGSFTERVQAALSGEGIAPVDITFAGYGTPSFWTAEQKRSVAAMFVDINH
jgi:hypothetical protein